MPRQKKPPTDWIHATVVARAEELGLSAYRLAINCGVAQSHIRDYIVGRKSMTSRQLHKLLTALGLTLVAVNGEPTK